MKRINKAFSGVVCVLLLAGLIVGVMTDLVIARAQETPNAITLDAVAEPSTVQAGEVFNLQLAIVGNPAACDPIVIRRPLNVVLAVDVSPSMDEKLSDNDSGTKLDGAIEALKAFVDLAQPADQIGLVSFSAVGNKLEDLSPAAEIVNTIEALREPSQRGNGTDLEAGIVASSELLSINNNSTNSPVVILLTDGQQTSGDSTKAAEQAKAGGLRVITIGLGPKVDTALLTEIASQNSDYYYAPQSSDLPKIYKSVAESIQVYDPATQLEVRYTFDASNFDLLSESISPPADVSVNQITWKFSRLESNPQIMTVPLRARVPGKYEAALSGHLTYLACAEKNVDIDLTQHFPVEVVASDLVGDSSCGKAAANQSSLKLTCSLPWRMIVTLLTLLIGLIFWLLRNRNSLRGWRQCGIRPSNCVLFQIPLLIYVALLLGTIAQMIALNVCTPREGLLFWRVNDNLSSELMMKPTEPDLPVRPVIPATRGDQCMGCHTLQPETEIVTSVMKGTNGPIINFDLLGRELGELGLQGSYPSWSPDGRQLAYAADGQDIYIYDQTLGYPIPLQGASEPNIVESMPAWSRDGQLIAFVRSAGSGQDAAINQPSDIMIISSRGGQPQMLLGASGQGYNYHPSFSPDGKWIAFTRHLDGSTNYGDPKAEIYLVPSQGGLPRRLEANDGPNGQRLTEVGNTLPTWSPDSSRLYFSSRRCGNQPDLFTTLIGEDGTSGIAQRLTELSSEQSFEYNVQTIIFSERSFASLIVPFILLLAFLPILLLIGWWLCRSARPESLPDTIEASIRVKPDKGWLLPRERFNINIDLARIGVCEPKISNQPVDVILLMDTSGSMADPITGSQSRLDAAKKAATRFVRCVVGPRERVGLIQFDSTSIVREPLINDRKRLTETIDGLRAAGSTRMEEGIDKARELLTTDNRIGCERVIILLSDGVPDDLERVRRAMAQVHSAGIRVIPVGIGEADVVLLGELAADQETVVYARDTRELESAFMQAARKLHQPIPASAIRVIHHYDNGKFELIGEPTPKPFEYGNGLIVWELDELRQSSASFQYVVRPKSAGEQIYIDQGSEIIYYRCESNTSRTIQITPSVPVTILERWQPPQTFRILPDIQFDFQQPRQVWQPHQALFVGVGGTGRWVLTHLKKNLQDAKAGEPLDGMRFLVIDVNEKELINESTMPVSFAGVELDRDDVFVLSENLSTLSRDTINRNYGDWFELSQYDANPESMNLKKGTSGNRPIARLALLRNLETTSASSSSQLSLHDRILESCRSVIRIDADKGTESIHIFLVSSLAGGMSGILPDLATELRSCAEELVGTDGKVTFEAYLADGSAYANLPGGKDAPAQRLANSFASLREISWLQLTTGHELKLSSNLDGGARTLRKPVFDETIFFSRAEQNEDALRYGLYPTIADVITARLDRATGDDKISDFLQSALRIARETRQNQEHAWVVGSAGTYTYRLPVADIIDQLNARWMHQSMRTYLCGGANYQPTAISCTPPGFKDDPAECLDGILSWGILNVGPYPESQELADSLYRGIASSTFSDEFESRARLGTVVKEDARKLFAYAVIGMLIANSEPMFPETHLGRMYYARDFLSESHKKFSELIEKTAEDSLLVNIGRAYLEAVESIQKSVQELLTEVLDLLNRLEQADLALRSRQDELSRITSRRYLWLENTNKIHHEIASPIGEHWWKEKFEQEVMSIQSFIHWDWSATRGLDLSIHQKGSTLSLMTDGREFFQTGLQRIARHFGRDLWQQASLHKVLIDQRIPMSADEGHTVAEKSSPIFDLSADLGLMPRQIAFMATPEIRETLSSSSFENSCLSPHLGPRHDLVSLNKMKLEGTDPTALTILQIQPSIRLDMTPGFRRSLVSYNTRDGYDRSKQEFIGATSDLPRLVMVPQISARFYERMYPYLVSGNPEPQVLHPYIVSALQDPDAAEIFCLALVSGLIKTNDLGTVTLEIPKATIPVILISRARPFVEPMVDALLTWCLNPPGERIAMSEAIERHYLSLSTQQLSLAIESYNLLGLKSPILPDLESLYALIYMVIAKRTK